MPSTIYIQNPKSIEFARITSTRISERARLAVSTKMIGTTKIYCLKPEGFGRLERKLVLRGIVVGLVAVGTVFAIQLATAKLSLLVMALALPIIVFALASGIRRGLNMQRDGWSSYRLVLADDFVIKQQANMPDVEIGRGEIAKLIQTHAGIEIKTRDRLRVILVPASLDGYDEVTTTLQEWRDFEDESSRSRRRQWLLALVVLVEGTAFAAVMISGKAIVVLPSGIFVITTMVWGYLELKRSPNVDARLKKTARVYWIVALFVAFRVILVMVT